MNVLAAERLGVYPLSSVMIVDDTPVGIEAGKNAGMTTVAVSLTGNAMGHSESEVKAHPQSLIVAWSKSKPNLHQPERTL